jgi:hypothetical protein
VKEILIERRKELFGEGFFGYYQNPGKCSKKPLRRCCRKNQFRFRLSLLKEQ